MPPEGHDRISEEFKALTDDNLVGAILEDCTSNSTGVLDISRFKRRCNTVLTKAKSNWCVPPPASAKESERQRPTNARRRSERVRQRLNPATDVSANNRAPTTDSLGPASLELLFCGRSGQNRGLSGGDPPNPPCSRRACSAAHVLGRAPSSSSSSAFFFALAHEIRMAAAPSSSCSLPSRLPTRYGWQQPLLLVARFARAPRFCPLRERASEKIFVRTSSSFCPRPRLACSRRAAASVSSSLPERSICVRASSSFCP
jgi:hypothetical protein